MIPDDYVLPHYRDLSEDDLYSFDESLLDAELTQLSQRLLVVKPTRLGIIFRPRHRIHNWICRKLLWPNRRRLFRGWSNNLTL